MKNLSHAILVAVAVTMVFATVAFAAGLSDGDYRYLLDRYGLAQDSTAMKTLEPDQQATLHDVINDKSFAQRTVTRDANVDDFVFGLLTCRLWQTGSHKEPCPMADRVIGASAGKRAADRYCNTCHLVGTPSAPSFYLLAQKATLTPERLQTAIDSGHKSDMIAKPSPGELNEIAAYINGMKRTK